MNKNQHIVIGTIIFVLYLIFFFLMHPIDSQVIVFSYVALLAGSIIPDVVEPASDWKHRGFGHSKRVLKKMALVFFVCSLIAIVFQYSLIVSSFLLGYIVHLLADATTKVGLMD